MFDAMIMGEEGQPARSSNIQALFVRGSLLPPFPYYLVLFSGGIYHSSCGQYLSV